MRKVLLLTGVACLAAASASALEFNPYIAAKAKYVVARNEVKLTGTFEDKAKLHDNIFGASFAVGNTHPLEVGDLRFELEYTKNDDAKKQGAKVKSQAVLFNIYYDFDVQLTVPVTPYLGIGLGWGRTEWGDGTKNVKEDDVSMQIGGGISYNINENAIVDFGYRFITYGDFDEEYRIPGLLYEKYEYKPRAHEIMLGIRYQF